MQKYVNEAFPTVGPAVEGIYDGCDFRGTDLSGREMSGLFLCCDFTGANFHGMMTRIGTLFFECKGLPAWLKRPNIGAKKGELWSENRKVR